MGYKPPNSVLIAWLVLAILFLEHVLDNITYSDTMVYVLIGICVVPLIFGIAVLIETLWKRLIEKEI